MQREFVFWIIMLLWLICGFGAFHPSADWRNRATFGGNIVLFILLGLLGWTVFGKPIQ